MNSLVRTLDKLRMANHRIRELEAALEILRTSHEALGALGIRLETERDALQAALAEACAANKERGMTGNAYDDDHPQDLRDRIRELEVELANEREKCNALAVEYSEARAKLVKTREYRRLVEAEHDEAVELLRRTIGGQRRRNEWPILYVDIEQFLARIGAKP